MSIMDEAMAYKGNAYRRVEPHVKFPCDIDYDPFQVMREKDLKYGKCYMWHLWKGG